MKTKLLILTLGAALALSSCSTVQYTASTVKVDAKIQSLTVADMDVSPEKVTKTTSWKWNPLSTVSLAVEKDNTTAQLLDEAGADVLVEPQYIVKRRGIFRGGSVTVTGFPAKYKSFRPMTAADAEMLSLANGSAPTYVCGGQQIIGAGNSPKVRKVKTARRTSLFSEKPRSHKFIDIIGGGAFSTENSDCQNGDFGLMFGKYGQRWGWYVKGIFSTNTGGDTEDDSKGGYATFGAIKTITNNFNVFAGVGLGAGIGYEYEYYRYGGYYYTESVFSVPLEIGFQWNVSHFNLLAGVNFNILTDTSYDNAANIGPFVGIGYTF